LPEVAHHPQQVERAAGVGAFSHVEHRLVADADFLPTQPRGDPSLADRHVRFDEGRVEIEPPFLNRRDHRIEAEQQRARHHS